ncbi:angiogenic factor with G patch and FHA domains 1 isoform X2 [Halyomorpha halys]|uniref:angiogenic factor with G patch and FHA domains 1 isoform X2 n=1 Tax=Halyomorpha halys TaxID=286706 RepID=UPI0006D503A9|nr:angiogenic factor with G patch and FHA domains 1 isoform X2 [Halyomorpha halys]
MMESPDLDSKLRLLTKVFHELYTESPAVLRNFLKDYRHLFVDEDCVTGKESPKYIEIACQTDAENDTNQWNPASIVEDVTVIAEKVTHETGFNYDPNSGWYFDVKMNCYYNPNYRLYYYREHNSYYYYDEESKELKFYCTLPSQGDSLRRNSTDLMDSSIQNEFDDQDPQPSGVNERPEDRGNPLIGDKEEGECSGSDEKALGHNASAVKEAAQNPNPTPVVIEAGPTVFEPNNTKHFAPCIRVVVTSSTLPELSYGTLFIVTCTGGTIGREGNHDVLIPDQLVSKIHCKFQYVKKDGLYMYELIDLGSKNGTYVNGKRLSDSLVQSVPTTISHGSVITVGRTDLLCHIHPHDETCQDCTAVSVIMKGPINDFESDITLKEKHHKEALSIRKKFGIINLPTTKLPEGYEDRAEVRRKQVGSSHYSEKTEAASVNEPICKRNKGYSLLSKMGWKEGETLGKRNEGATLEPILPVERVNKTSGFGCDNPYPFIEKSKKSNVTLKTLERYNQGL